MTKFEHLQAGILQFSQAAEWEAARLEWTLHQVYFNPMTQTCLCTHSPIMEVCVLENPLTRHRVEVGNCCVKRFLELPSGLIFDALKRVRQQDTNALNEEAVRFFHQKGYLTDWDKAFYLDTLRKRKLSARQQTVRQRINQKVMRQL